MNNFQVRLEDEDYEPFSRKAEERGCTLSDAARLAIRKWTGERPASPLEAVSSDEARMLEELLQIVQSDGHQYHDLVLFIAQKARRAARRRPHHDHDAPDSQSRKR